MINKERKAHDHLGNEFNSMKDMVKYYNMESDHIYFHRMLSLGWSQEEALNNTGKMQGKKVHDHLGNEFSTITEMCNYWNIRKVLYRLRIINGWSQEEALTGNFRLK